MKRKIISLLGAVVLGTIALTGCSKNSNKVDLYAAGELGTISNMGSKEVFFKENSKVPYVNLEEGVELMSLIRSTNLDNPKYKYTVTKENNNYVVSNESGAKCVISPEKQTFVFDEYNKFSYMVTDNQNPISITSVKPDTKALKLVSSEYQKGNTVTIDLKSYSRLDIYEKDGNCYLPVSVFNDILLNSTGNVNLAYNGKAYFLLTGEVLTQRNLEGELELTTFGEKFREGVETSSITEEFAEYNYQSMCLDFDYSYGLKDKFNSFDEFVTKLGYKNELLSTNPKTIDTYTAITLSHLVDGHTALSDVSNLYKMSEAVMDDAKMNKTKSDWHKADEVFAMMRKAAEVQDGIHFYEDKETVFVSFKEFTNINEGFLYNTDTAESDDFTGLDDSIGLDFGSTNDLKLENTACLFNQLYKDLTSDLHKWTTKNIVVDLTANDGGASDGLIYALSTLLGNIKTDMTNPLSGGHTQEVYKADINADGVVDDKDVPLVDLGFKIYFLDSKYSFSSANAMPVIAKLNNPNVITLGAKTAGGPCAVRYVVTPIGSGYNSSSVSTISKLVNDKYVNIDDGVAADFTLEEAQMLNRQYIADNIANWVK